MARVDLQINRNSYAVVCEDGDESRLRRLAGVVEERLLEILAETGEIEEGRGLLMAALLLADELDETKAALAEANQRLAIRAPDTERDEGVARVIETLIERVNRVTDRLDAPAS